MGEKTGILTVDKIQNRVYVIRGQQVMLDCDIAEIYGYEVKRLNEQVKRNISRFPKDFMFQLEKEEIPEGFLKSQFTTLNDGFRAEEKVEGENLKSQFATSSDISATNGRTEKEILKSQIVTSSWGGKRKLPYAFTEQGIYMLATVLRGELAEQQSIFIMRAFREMRHYIKQNQQFVVRTG